MAKRLGDDKDLFVGERGGEGEREDDDVAWVISPEEVEFDE